MKGHRVPSSRLHNLALALTALGLFVALARPVEAGEQCGEASFYGAEHHGRLTASGEPFNMWAMTAAHRTLAFDTMVRVCRTDTGACVTVRINDRGPASWTGRVIDLSQGAADVLGMVRRGVAQVCLVWS